MAKFSVDNDFTSHYNNFISKADLIIPKNINLKSSFGDVQSDGDQPTPIVVFIFDTRNNFYLWVNLRNQLFSAAPDNSSPFAKFNITTPEPSDPSRIQIRSVAFSDPRIIAADFSGGSPNLIIASQTDSDTLVSKFQLGGTNHQSISVTDPSSETTYYWDIADDWAVILTSQPSEVFELNSI